jgi:hypothetical protein
MLKQLLFAASVGLPLVVVAQDKPAPQQQKMATCNKTAGEKKLSGDARKAFMSECLSAPGGTAAATESKKERTPQQQKMADCNAQAGAKKLAGDERKQFMSACLKS